MNIDICELLQDYANKSKNNIESKLMLEAIEEIKRLRSDLDFQIKLANDINNSRLRLLDVIENGKQLFEETCKNVRDITGEDHVCGMCQYDCDTSIGPSGDYIAECPGFDKDDCFELNIEKYNNIVFKNDKKKVKDYE